MAYLIPALAWADTNGKRVIVSTNTINLQDQLLHKDIPDLCKLLNKEYRTAILKGRGNYLCPVRLSAQMQVGPRSADEIRILAKVLVWLYQGGSGDRSELSLRGPGEMRAWAGISSDSEDCTPERCRQQGSGACPYYRAQSEAESAHIVIVNHALLLADIATGNRVIPEYQYLIVDEAHHLESATTNGLSYRGTDREIMRGLRDLGSIKSGLIGSLLRQTKAHLPPELLPSVEEELETISEVIDHCKDHTQEFFKHVLLFMDRRRDGQPIGIFGHNERIVPSTRTLNDWNEIELVWDNASEPMDDLIHRLDRFCEDLTQSENQTLEGLGFALRSILRVLQDSHYYFDELVFKPDPGRIYWIELRPAGQQITFHGAPLEIGQLIEKYLWHAKESVIMTSATMTTMGNFDYLRQRLNAGDADELALGSPFDYENSTLLYLIDDIPEPHERQAYQRAFENGLRRLAIATEGRMLVLFTSHQQLSRTMKAISSSLFAEGILVLAQSSGASRHSLLETFKNTDKAVLLGTRSFWEGVDVPGEALSVLAIARLPFDVPSDPIVAARAETYEFPFEQYSIPEAVLRFRQGFGRLIRTKSDRGVVVNFDRRLLSKRYGKAFIDSLPACTLRKGNLANMPKEVTRWIGQ
jgi:DNA polymerase-3 subunit epsilon/ATP-dependent DNA helicase DinG